MSTSPKPKYRIFISHSSKDDEFGIKLAQDLRHLLGDVQTVWYDHTPENGLPGGSDWHMKIEEALEACSTFIVILSPDATASKWVMHETETVTGQKLSGKRKYIIPLMFQPCKGKIFKLLDAGFQRVTFPPADPTKTYEAALHDLLLAFKPKKNISIVEIQRILEEANVAVVQEAIMEPEVQAAIAIGEFDVAFERLRLYSWAYQMLGQWNYALHYCEMALKIKPDNTQMQSIKRTIQDYIEREKNSIKISRPRRNVYRPYWTRVRKTPEVAQIQEPTQKNRRRKAPGSNRTKPNEEAASYHDTDAILIPSARKKLPHLRTGHTVDFMGEVSSLLNQTSRFLRNTLSTKELSAYNQGIALFSLFVFFTTDVFLAAVGFKFWLSTLSLTGWGILCGFLLLVFAWGIFNTSSAVGIALTGLFWIEWSLLAYHFLKPFLFFVSLAGLACAYLRFILLFRKHKRKVRRRRRYTGTIAH